MHRCKEGTIGAAHVAAMIWRAGALLLLISVASNAAAAQIPGRLKDAVKAGIENRRAATEDYLIMRSALIGDSLTALGLAPIDSLVSNAATGVESAFTHVVSGLAGVDGEVDPARLNAGLGAGRVDLTDVFVPSTAEPTAGGEKVLATLAALLAERGEPVLLEAFAPDWDEPDLGERRVRVARTMLVAYGVDPAAIIAAAGDPQPEAAEAGVPFVELRIRPLHSVPQRTGVEK